MTFTEAAALVLRLVGKPLHYKEITDVAIEKNLLSHVGKSPEVTMGARLAALVKKAEKDNPLVRVKPGVFALRDWDQSTIDKGLSDRTPALELAKRGEVAQAAAAAVEVQSGENGAREHASSPLASSPLGSSPNGSSPIATGALDDDDEELIGPDDDERARAALASSAAELFEAEDDDDVPLIGPGAVDAESAEGDDDPNGARRRRRRRRGRGRDRDDREEGDLPGYTVSDAPADEALAREDAPRRDESRRDESRRDESRRDESRRDDSRRDDSRRGRDGRDGRDERDRFGDANLDELAGKNLADVLERALAGQDRAQGPISAQRLADLAVKRGRSQEPGQLASALLGAARADNLRRAQLGRRARFRVAGGRIALTEWGMDGEMLKLERELEQVADRYREAARRALQRRIADLPPRAMGEFILLLLERLGVTELSPVRRPGAPGAELHLSGVARGPLGELRTAIVLRRDGREVGRERVLELRGALHHYGPATSGMLLTTGQVLSGAREEAQSPGAAPVTLIDGAGVARLAEQHGVLVQSTRIELPVIDLELLESLRA
ncbi:MAG: restriction endonuclease [Polyangiaceae bacterium]|nr:restriction endonuclease [Polyangiaceae bacterium]